MAFPDKNWLGFPKGWKNLGLVEESHRIENGEVITLTERHTFCNSRLKIGREGQEMFKFCPRCLIKTDSNSRK